MKEAALVDQRPLRIPLSNEQKGLQYLENIEKLLATLVEQGARPINAPAAGSGSPGKAKK